MPRSLVLNLHLVLSSIFIPFLLLIPLSGSLYLLGVKGDAPKTEVMTLTASVPSERAEKVEYFRKLFAENKIDYEFEYIKETPVELIFRPTSKDYYTAKVKDGTVTLYQVKPTALAKIMELHKGHGPQIMRKFEAAFGISLILILLSGLWLSLTVTRYRKITLVSAGIGLVLLGILVL